MKSTLSILILVIVLSSGFIVDVNKNSLKKLEWIIGTWKRENAKPTETHHERWWKISDQHFEGIGVVMVEDDTAFAEKLSIKIEDGTVYYIADVPGNPAPVYFKFTSWKKSSFVSENPEHDLPKKIAYSLKGNIMTARVSWDNGEFDAIFRKVD